jgi:tetratricopeptide (TPR) repeat protein
MRSMPGPTLDLQRFREGDNPAVLAQVRLEAVKIAARRGDLDEARRLLRAALQATPDDARLWLQLAWLTSDPQERKAVLRQVLALEPDNPRARSELARLRPVTPPSATARRVGKRHTGRWILALLVLVALALLTAILVWGPVDSSLAWLRPTATPAPTPLPTRTPAQIAARFAPQLEAALSGANWDRALELVAIMESVDPAGAEVQAWAQTTHMQCGQAMVQAGDVQEAQAQFDRAVALAPDDAEALLWQETTRHYLAGEAALDRADWQAAVEAFGQAQALMPGYADVALRLVEAYRRQGQAAIEREQWGAAIEALLQAHERLPGDPDVAPLLSQAFRGQGQAAMSAGNWTAAVDTLIQAREYLPGDGAVTAMLVTARRQRGIVFYDKGQLKKARADLEAALALQPGDAEAQAYLDKVMYELFPPKRIEIDISKQHFYAWEGDTLVYSFATSTGLPGRDTATGHYRVLDKIPMAYSSIWRLKMPHWLGIYYVGNVENGIHALPIRPDGSVMWGGLLGQKASYGCVILSTEAARLIYNWADVGTPVDIHY